jgi:predicted ester cyclase
VVRWTARTTHSAELAGIPASCKKVQFSGMTWLRFKDGRIIEGWDRWNLNALLGLLASGTTTATAKLQQE